VCEEGGGRWREEGFGKGRGGMIVGLGLVTHCICKGIGGTFAEISERKGR